MAYISTGYGSDTDTYGNTSDCGTVGTGNGWVVVASATAGDTATSCYIIPHDLMIMDPNALNGVEPDFVITESVPVQYWPELYHEDPHHVPVCYEPAPRNIKPMKSAPRITNHIIKQPGPMRRGNRI